MRYCKNCQTAFKPNGRQEYCTARCRKNWWEKNYIHQSSTLDKRNSIEDLELQIENRKKKILKLKRENYIEELKQELLPPCESWVMKIDEKRGKVVDQE